MFDILPCYNNSENYYIEVVFSAEGFCPCMSFQNNFCFNLCSFSFPVLHHFTIWLSVFPALCVELH